ncbi:hypothetical protein [uncultured Photobacterium sp.]|uniref:hypothetical protein n=1 Tax=uncultured Photobacterium sp. TaxID=173973 RepID=UPI0026153692|nr:hypothetical protein [uncultured Photobacterium sp.]
MILALSASVTGCLDGSSSKTKTTDMTSYSAGDRPHVIFSPHSQQMDLVNDLRFGARFAAGVDYYTADDGVVSINGRRGLTLADSDGFSTSAQFDVTFSQPLDPDSVSFTGPTQNVFLLPLKSNSDEYVSLASYPGNGSALIDQLKLDQQQFRANVVTLDGKNSVLRISPLAPLASKTKYLVILTNTLRDTNGQPVVAADDYSHFSNSAQPEADSPLAEVVSRWHSMASDALVAIAGGFAENGKSSYLSADRQKAGEQVAHAFTFTTTTGTEMLEVLASPEMAKARPVGIIRRDLTVGKLLDPFLKKLGVIFTSLDSEALAAQFSTTVENIEQLKQTDLSSLTGSNVDLLLGSMGLDYPSIKFVQGHITLPYYLAKPDLDEESGHIKPASLSQFAKDEWITDASGDDSPAAVMSPKKTADYKVPFLVTLPEAQHKPAQGWPVVIFQHGILGDRSNSFPAGMALASMCDKERPENDCFATIAMDLPLHGISPQLLVGNAAVPSPFIGFGMDSLRSETAKKLDELESKVTLSDSEQEEKAKLNLRQQEMQGIVERHFSATRTPTGQMETMSWDPTSLKGSSGSTFMNFSNVLSQRDRMRQAISDLLNLNASLASLNELDVDGDGNIGDFDISRVYFVGHSLGGVLGMPFVAVNNDPTVQKNNPGLPKIQATALLTTGGGVPKLLEHSPGFRPEILGALKHLGSEQSLELGTKAFEHYFYTLQSMIDGIDPLNYAAKLKASDTGIYMAEVVGGAPVLDGYGYQQYTAEGEPMFTLPDQTIPNSADGKPVEPYKGSIAAPLAGTEPMIKLMGLQSLKPNAAAVNQSFSVTSEHGEPLKVVARFNRGTHVTPVMALENIQRLMVDNKDLSKVSMSFSGLISNQPIVHLIADSIKRSGGLFLEMTGHVSDFFTHNGTKVAVNDADFLSRIDPHAGDIPLPPIKLANKQPKHCEIGKECIIDNDEPAFEKIGSSWTVYRDRAGDTQGETYAYASNYADHAAWWFRVARPGTYRVSMRTPSDFSTGLVTHGATTGALYNVFSSSGESGNKLFNLVGGTNLAAPFDYTLAPNGKYVELGEFVFADVNRDYKVTLHNRSTEYKYTGPLIADAIKIEYVSPNTNMSAAAELQQLIGQTESFLASVQIGGQQGQHSQAAINNLQHELDALKQAAVDNTMSAPQMQTLKREFEASLTAFKCMTPDCVSTESQGKVMDNTASNFSVTVAGTLKTANNGQYGDDYYYSTDEDAVAEWTFSVAKSGRYQIAFNSPGNFDGKHGYGSDKTLYQVLKGEQTLVEKTVDTYGKTHEFESMTDIVYLFEGVQYKVRVSGAYHHSGWFSSYDCGLVADAIKVTYQP